jgi:hypothetical protein
MFCRIVDICILYMYEIEPFYHVFLQYTELLLCVDNHYLKMLNIGTWSGVVEVWDMTFSTVRHTYRLTDRQGRRGLVCA